MRLRTFGGLGLDSAARELGGAAAQRRPLALLLLLAAAGDHGISRDKLVSYLWPEKDAEHARNALRQTIYSLRRDLGAPELVLGGGDLRLNRALLPSDLAEFDDAVASGDFDRAVALYAGPLADGFFLSGGNDFERWLEDQRQLRARHFAMAVETLATDASRRGDFTRAAALWRKLAAQDRLNGKVALRLVEALADAGDRVGALQHARLHETLVREELGMPPDDAIVKVMERLRTPPRGKPVVAGTDDGASAHRLHAPAPTETSPNASATVATGDRLPRPDVRRRRRWMRAVLGVTAFVAGTALVGVVTMRVLRGSRITPASTPVVLAVAPFQVLDPELALWREGMMNVLSHNLDTSATLQTVAPAMVVRHWNRHPGTESARALARETGARVVLFGFLFRAGADSIRVTASLVDAGSQRESRTTRYESLRRQDLLTDSLTAFVVRELREWMPAAGDDAP